MVETTRKLAALMPPQLGGLRWIAGMINVVRFAEHAVLAAIGIEVGGRKHRAKGQARAAARKVPLADLIERGLPSDRAPLFVIGGAKAVRQAVTDTFRPPRVDPAL